MNANKKPALSLAEDELWREIKNQYSIVERVDVSEKIKTEVGKWTNDVSRRIDIDNPFDEEYKKISIAEEELQQGDNSLEAIESDITSFESLKQKTQMLYTDTTFWQNKLSELRDKDATLKKRKKKKGDKINISNMKNELKREKSGARRALQQHWRKELDNAYSEWELEQINNLRREFFEQIKSWLDLLQQLFDFFNDLSIEPGLLFDLSEGALTNTDIEILKHWVKYISQDEGAKKLCDLLGRLRRAEQSKREETIKYKTKINIDIPDVNSKEEITGVILGKDIENIIPEELALLSDDDTSLLFDLKYIENRLLCFETQGVQQQDIEIEKTKKIEISEEEKMGPIIICVDTSGSMQGAPETIAKAITLYMATKAVSQDRNCYLINFSTDIETLDLSGGIGIEKVIKFLQKSFHGGTDASPALQHAVEKIRTENYKQSDVLTISDFLMGNLQEDLYKNILDLKKEKNKFYSLCIGDQFAEKRLKDIFDKEWIYNPNNMSIKELHNFAYAID